MGWLIVFSFKPIIDAVPPLGIILLLQQFNIKQKLNKVKEVMVNTKRIFFYNQI